MSRSLIWQETDALREDNSKSWVLEFNRFRQMTMTADKTIRMADQHQNCNWDSREAPLAIKVGIVCAKGVTHTNSRRQICIHPSIVVHFVLFSNKSHVFIGISVYGGKASNLTWALDWLVYVTPK